MTNFPIPAFPKIFAIGSKQTERIFNSEVEITEKIDGSQIAFGVINGELHMRSKGSPLYRENPEKMFSLGIDSIVDKFERGLLLDGFVYHGEYLKQPRHSTLKYNRIPKNHIAIYGVSHNDEFISDYEDLFKLAEEIEMDIVPLLYRGKVNTIEDLKSNIDRESVLGGCKIEGFVVKNYNEQLLIGGQVIPILMGKYVSEDFKEVHRVNWKRENTNKGKWEVYKSQFTSPARWIKAVHRLRDQGKLNYDPKDIGTLLKEINIDVAEEEKENILEFLWNHFGKELIKDSTKGFPQWYKEYLLDKSVNSAE